MSVFSKYYTSGILVRRQLSLYGARSCFTLHMRTQHRLNHKILCCIIAPSNLNKDRMGHLVLMNNVKYFRWDAKPDNIMGHRRTETKMHWIPFSLMVFVFMTLFNWETVFPKKDREKSSVPVALQDFFRFIGGSRLFTDQTESYDGGIPSSFASHFVDKHGEKGVKALSEAWEEVKQMDLRDQERMVHVLMTAEAKLRYQDDVAAQAAEMGLSEEPEVKKLLGNEDEQPETSGWTRSIFSVKAEEAVESIEDGALDLSDDEDGSKVEKLGFRDRKIIEYENRIRQYSTPDKVFRYFATYKLSDDKGNNEVMMTPEDFLRSISPGEKQPENLGLDQYHQISTEEINRMTPLKNLDQSSIFYQLGAGGLISFSDYIFLLTVLSTSRRHFEIAFKMFDLNGDGTVDAEEFEKVTTLLRSSSSTGARHRDHGNTGSTFKGINSGLIAFFFGEDKTGTLTVDRFLDFQLKLQEEMLALEFKRKDLSERGRIPERDFADLLIAYAGFSTKKKQKMLRRVKKSYDTENSPGISLKDYLNFYQVLYCINDIDTALTFHTIAGAPIERSTMKHVSRTVAHVELSDHLVDVVFTLFDDNGDGMLSNKEFVSVMKQRAKRGLEKPKEIGISRVFSSVVKCAGDCRPAIMGGVKKTE